MRDSSVSLTPVLERMNLWVLPCLISCHVIKILFFRTILVYSCTSCSLVLTSLTMAMVVTFCQVYLLLGFVKFMTNYFYILLMLVVMQISQCSLVQDVVLLYYSDMDLRWVSLHLCILMFQKLYLRTYKFLLYYCYYNSCNLTCWHHMVLAQCVYAWHVHPQLYELERDSKYDFTKISRYFGPK